MKNAIVFGGTGGIGSELKNRLVKSKYSVISVSKSEKNDIKCDFTKTNQVEEAIKELKRRVNTLDLIVYASGIATYKNLVDVSDKELIDAFMVNVISPTIFIRELIPLMHKSDSLVLSIGSGAGKIPMRGRSVYCSTKFALRGMSLSLSEEYKNKRPSFCHITLGSTLTGFGPKTIEEKQKEANSGKAYFPIDWVADKLLEIIKNIKRNDEIVLFPSEHGFGEWKKP